MYKQRAVRDKNGKLISQVRSAADACVVLAEIRATSLVRVYMHDTHMHAQFTRCPYGCYPTLFMQCPLLPIPCAHPTHHTPSPSSSPHTNTHTQELQSKELPSTRIQPDRRWFGNTRVVGQKQLEQFRTEMATKVNDSYTVLLREKKLPLQLLEDPEKKLKGKQVRGGGY